ncbi:MAG TPA: hypothetical protein VMX54_08550 [Vicinamibacteria bacterium]|nr:hypothetical protein [Vicinamibacteria bacterium]
MVPIRRLLAVAATGVLAFAAAALSPASAVRAFAQEVVQDEGAAYRAWYEASQANDTPKALQAAKDYLAKYPAGQYADAIKKWLPTAQMKVLDSAIKEKRTGDMIATGNEILAGEPDNLNVLYALAFNIRRNELLASPPNFQNAAAAADYARRAASLIEAGKGLAGVSSFDKNATLAWLTQILALVEQKGGAADRALELFEKSTSLAPQDPQVAGRNLLAVLAMRQAAYADAAKAYNAIPEADRAAADAKPEVKAAHDKVNADADAYIDAAARFVALAKVKGLPPAITEKVQQSLEGVYKSRFPDDAPLAGLQKILQEKEAALGAPPAAPSSN